MAHSKRLVHGLGLNDYEGKVSQIINGKEKMCPYYSKWKAMLRRVATLANYKECSVCEEWLTFSNFKGWMERQDWEGKYLDKDLLKVNNLVYSPETCLFVPQYINSVTRNFKNVNGAGLYKPKRTNGKYMVFVYHDSKQHYIGIFLSKEEAQLAWVKFKKKIVIGGLEDKGFISYKELLINYFNALEESIKNGL